MGPPSDTVGGVWQAERMYNSSVVFKLPRSQVDELLK